MKRPEQLLQRECVRYLRMIARQRDFMFFHVPNGGYRTRVEAGIFRALGVRAGVADLCFVWRPLDADAARVAFVELKAGKGGLTDSQDQFRADCERLGAPYAVVRAVSELEGFLERWQICERRTRTA